MIPYYAYARSDKKSMPRVSIGGRLVADLLVTAGASRVLAMTLHSPQVHGFFSIPVDHLHALREFADHFSRLDLSQLGCRVARPRQRQERRRAGAAAALPVAAGAKERHSDEKVTISSIIGDVEGRDVIVLDDEIARGTTIIELLDRLHERDVRSVRIACTHGLFSDGALKRIAAQPLVREIVVHQHAACRRSAGPTCMSSRSRRRWPRPSGASTRASQSARCSVRANLQRVRDVTPPFAHAATWLRELKPSLARMLATCRAAVAGLMNSFVAMSRLLRPAREQRDDLVLARRQCTRGLAPVGPCRPRHLGAHGWPVGARSRHRGLRQRARPDSSASRTAAAGVMAVPSCQSRVTACSPRPAAASRNRCVRAPGIGGRCASARRAEIAPAS